MNSKKKSNAGRKPLTEAERLTAITVFVKGKHKDKATKECLAIANKYR